MTAISRNLTPGQLKDGCQVFSYPPPRHLVPCFAHCMFMEASYNTGKLHDVYSPSKYSSFKKKKTKPHSYF